MPVDLAHSKLLYRIWPAYATQWFDPAPDSATPVRATIAEARDLGVLDACVGQIKSYLTQLLGYPPPDAWLAGSQFEVLFEELKHLVGDASACQAGRGRNITIGNALLLLAAVDGGRSRPWLTKVEWTELTTEILPKQTREQAVDSTKALVALYNTLHGTGADTRWIYNHQFQPTRLIVELDAGSPEVLANIRALAICENPTDALSQAYTRWEDASQRDTSGGSLQRRSVVNLRPVPDSEKALVLLGILSWP